MPTGINQGRKEGRGGGEVRRGHPDSQDAWPRFQPTLLADFRYMQFTVYKSKLCGSINEHDKGDEEEVVAWQVNRQAWQRGWEWDG